MSEFCDWCGSKHKSLENLIRHEQHCPLKPDNAPLSYTSDFFKDKSVNPVLYIYKSSKRRGVLVVCRPQPEGGIVGFITVSSLVDLLEGRKRAATVLAFSSPPKSLINATQGSG